MSVYTTQSLGGSSDVKDLLREHGAVVFRNGPLTKHQLRGVAEMLGPVETNPHPGFRDAECPWVYPISNRGKGHTNENVRYWHFDGSRLEKRSRFTLLYAELAGKGGDLMLAPTTLSPLRIMHGLVGLLDNGRQYAMVQVHPDTGKLVLQVNTGKTVDPDLSKLSAELDARSEVFVYQDHDLLVIDNFSFLHKATAPDDSVERLIYRVTTTHQEGA